MSKRVLLVEDEPNITEAIRFLLQREGWRVSTHADGATALDAVNRVSPDIVLLDVMLPNRSGLDILRDLRAAEGTADLPVVMLTAKGQERDRALAESHGANRFISKPFSNAEIVDTIRALMP